ncbi:unnamed protein product [Mytilus coruscus]|uniref:Mab-21-like HhH/H2TH-like domain-containing protein n=1 Tax=Mytilus coruscus TaxID=42192 RepID=A0A6J8AKF0_MYTCO|nr:unnamed protein product [Mytilus coruscus]
MHAITLLIVAMEFPAAPLESNFSLELFDFLCKIVGSEKDVRARRIFFKVLDHALQYSPKWRVVTSGRKSEGLDLPGSDLDITYINQVDTVYNTKSTIPSDLQYGLFLDFENTPPGYVHIELHQKKRHGIQPNHVYSGNHIILSNEHYKQLIQEMNMPNAKNKSSLLENFSDIHGPCSSTICGSYDFLSTYKCHSWPTVVAEWITRPRNYEWPPTELIEDIVRDNILLAPIGSKSNNKKENPFEWRMSFSIAEKMLVHSFNHTQILCYALLKYTLKEVLVVHQKIKDTMCSYFMKTVLFWMIEESQISEWQPCKLFECFQACIKRLVFFIQYNILPNYFIPQNNLIEGKIDVPKKKLLISLLRNFFTSGNNSLKQIQTLSYLFDHIKTPLTSELFRKNYSNIDSIIYPLLHYMHGIGYGGSNTIYQPIYCIMSHRKCKLLKHICFIWFSKLCGSLAKHYPFMISHDGYTNLQNRKCNKTFYPDYKKCIWYTILGTFSDSYTGWLLLAEFFFQRKQLRKTAEIIQLCQFKSSTDHQMITPGLKPHPSSKMLENIGLHFVQRYKHSCSDLFYLTPKAKPQIMFYQEDYQSANSEKDMLIVHPQIRMYYLLFLCHHYLGNNIEKWKALRLLKDFNLQSTTSAEYLNSIIHLTLALREAETIPDFILNGFLSFLLQTSSYTQRFVCQTF